MRLKASSIVLVTGVLLLAGCTQSAPAPESSSPSPTETTPANADACEQFGALVDDVPTALSGDIRETWPALRDDFDAVALVAEGETAERMSAFVDAWPDASQIVVYKEFDEFNTAVGDVERSCVADGNESTFPRLTTG